MIALAYAFHVNFPSWEPISVASDVGKFGYGTIV